MLNRTPAKACLDNTAAERMSLSSPFLSELLAALYSALQLLNQEGTEPLTIVSCQMACCAMWNVLGAMTEPPNGNSVNGSFGNLVVETSAFRIAQQAI